MSGGLRFLLDTGGVLSLVYEPGDVAPPDAESVRRSLEEQGYGELYIDDEALQAFVQKAHDVADPITAVIGERRDGEYEIKIADDLMSAHLTLRPPYGGTSAAHHVGEELQAHGIVFGLFHARLQAALVEGHCEDLLIAQGKPPEDGVPARFEHLLPDVKERRPQVNQQGIVDYRNLGQILIVHPGDPLMRRYPAKPGKSGTNIKGEVVLARAVATPGFSPDISGAAPSPDDVDLLVSTITGQPVRITNGVLVNPVIEVPAVDLHSGNICFEGTLKVLGDVKSGMRIEVTGDVHVAGMVEAAELIAGGDVVIKGGVVGQLSTRGDTVQSSARIVAHGSVKALFMESAEVRSQQSILVDDYTNQCLLLAHHEIVFGGSGRRHGALMGGQASAMHRVRAEIIGSASGVLTRVQVGVDPYHREQQLRVERKIRGLEDDLERIVQLLGFLELNPHKAVGGLLEKAQRSREHAEGELEVLRAELDGLIADDQLAMQASIEAKRTIHSGSEIRIGGRCWQVLEDHKGCVLMLRDNELASV